MGARRPGSRKAVTLSMLMVIASFAASAALYPLMPDIMPSHWDAAGRVNGTMPKLWALFFMPIIGAGMLLLFIVLPRIDPLKANIARFRGYFDWFIAGLIAFLLYIYALTLLWASGITFNMMQAMSPAMGALFFLVGVLLKHAKRNWFIGIRTPWTLSSDKVWDETHKLGAKLFKASGILALGGMLLPQHAILIMLVPVISSAVITSVYSYIVYSHER